MGNKIKVVPIIKGNAYGHGIVEVSKTLSSHAKIFGVVSLTEAKLLRKNKIKNNIYYGKKEFQIDWADKNQRWDIEETEEEITMSTGMDNFDMHEFLIKIGVHDDNIKYNGI